MPLRRLTKLARTELEDEHKELLADIKYLKALLKDPKKLRGVIKDELLEIRKKHADARRTQIRADEGDLDIEDLIAEEDVIITVSRAGYVKRLPVDTFRRQGRGGKGVRGPEPQGGGRRRSTSSRRPPTTGCCSSRRRAACTASRRTRSPSRAGRRAASTRPTCPGVALDGDERISAVIDLKEYDGGQVPAVRHEEGHREEDRAARVRLAAHRPRSRSTCEPGDELIDVKLTDGKDDVFLVSRKGQAIRFKESLARPMGRATGRRDRDAPRPRTTR